jgi:hypothetical protein
VFVAISTVRCLAGRFWPWSLVVGIVLLLIAGTSKAEKKGDMISEHEDGPVRLAFATWACRNQ